MLSKYVRSCLIIISTNKIHFGNYLGFPAIPAKLQIQICPRKLCVADKRDGSARGRDAEDQVGDIIVVLDLRRVAAGPARHGVCRAETSDIAVGC